MSLPRADDILKLLLARQPEPLILEKRTGLPYGWGLWLRAMRPLPAPERREGMLTQLAQRPLPGSPGRLPQLGLLQAMRQLFWQHWDPPPRDQRGLRIGAAFTSGLLHVCFAALLLWVALIRPPAEPDQDAGEEGRVQVAFLGDDGPEGQGEQATSTADTGDGDGPTAAASAAREALPAVSPSASQSTPTASPPSEPAAQAEPVPTPEVAPVEPAPAVAAEPAPAASEPAQVAETAPPLEQPLQVTETTAPTGAFVVPPVARPTPQVTIQPRSREAPVPQVREREVTLVQRPSVSTPAPQVAEVQIQVPAREVQVRERTVTMVQQPTVSPAVRTPTIDVPIPTRDIQVRERAVQPVQAPDVRRPEIATPTPSPRVPTLEAPAVRERAITLREPASAPAPAQAPTRAPTQAPTPGPAAPAPAGAAASAPSTSSSGATPPARAPAGSNDSSAGRAPQPATGNWATQGPDDWGTRKPSDAGARQASSAGDGLFNADGSVRVPGTQAGEDAGGRGAPGSDSDRWSRDQIAQSGRWLKRPPYDYTPTSFDQYWAPSDSLLAEWVRRGIKKIEIPIPGTSSKISCVVSTLQFGGGCGLTNPNMNDQPAVARPPPDVPFKRELQEDNGAR